MSLLAEMTLVHIEAGAAIDRLGRGLARMEHQFNEPSQLSRELDQMISVALRARDKMDRFFKREQRELFPLAKRILGDGGSDLRRLGRARNQFLDAVDRFIVALSETSEKEDIDLHQKREFLEDLFEDVVRAFDEHCDAQRSFFQVHATILYPGGLATE